MKFYLKLQKNTNLTESVCDVHITSFRTNAYQNVSFIGHKAFEKRFTFYHCAIIPLAVLLGNLARLYLHWYIKFMCARPPSRPLLFCLGFLEGSLSSGV